MAFGKLKLNRLNAKTRTRQRARSARMDYQLLELRQLLAGINGQGHHQGHGHPPSQTSPQNQIEFRVDDDRQSHPKHNDQQPSKEQNHRPESHRPSPNRSSLQPTQLQRDSGSREPSNQTPPPTALAGSATVAEPGNATNRNQVSQTNSNLLALPNTFRQLATRPLDSITASSQTNPQTQNPTRSSTVFSDEFSISGRPIEIDQPRSIGLAPFDQQTESLVEETEVRPAINPADFDLFIGSEETDLSEFDEAEIFDFFSFFDDHKIDDLFAREKIKTELVQPFDDLQSELKSLDNLLLKLADRTQSENNDHPDAIQPEQQPAQNNPDQQKTTQPENESATEPKGQTDIPPTIDLSKVADGGMVMLGIQNDAHDDKLADLLEFLRLGMQVDVAVDQTNIELSVGIVQHFDIGCHKAVEEVANAVDPIDSSN